VCNWDGTQDTTLFACWLPTQYEVRFSRTYKDAKPKKTYGQRFVYGKAEKLAKNRFTRKKYVFAGWAKTSAQAQNGIVAYTDGQKVSNLSNDGDSVSLYAIWAKRNYSVKFYHTYSSVKGKMKVQSFVYGKAKKLAPNKFRRNGYAFRGWAKSATRAKTGKVDYKNKAIVKNLTIKGKTVKLYAVWKKK
jgi:uncharacterized repeat protein (TIGR02543 family)